MGTRPRSRNFKTSELKRDSGKRNVTKRRKNQEFGRKSRLGEAGA